jgi:hypothetical protein
LEGAAPSALLKKLSERMMTKSFKIIFFLAGSFLAIHLAWYFGIIGNDLKYLFVWTHALSTGPDYAPR